MSTALYRLYRPQKFSEVEGQASAVDVLIKSISKSRAAHAYLFSGARGCGKTTVARLTAKALNCASPADNYEPCCECFNCLSITSGDNLDVIEIDGASNNGVEEIRELKSHVSLAPFNSRFKVYIIDEVHMLSTAAFNALLKTLEEPPEYVVFILATTEPHKIPVTIRSRCQHIPFHRIRSFDILHRLEFVCKKENLEYENEALWEIARQADGALRDALSLLDQVMSLGKGNILLEDVSALSGGGSLAALQRWLSAWRDGGKESFTQLNDMFMRGASPQRAIEELFYISRNLWIARVFGFDCLGSADISKEEHDYIVEECKLWSPDSLERFMLFLAKLLPQVRIGMKTDVIVGILLSRRPEIVNGKERVESGELRVELKSNNRKLRMDSLHENAAGEEIKRPAPLVSQRPPANHKDEQHSDSLSTHKDKKHNDSLTTQIDEEALSLESFNPLGEEIRDEFFSNLRSADFTLFCALIDCEFLYSVEQKKIYVITKHVYLFHFLSGGRSSLTFINMVREKFPECELMIVFEGKSYKYSETSNRHQVVKMVEGAENEPVEIMPPVTPQEELEVRKGSAVYDAAYSAMRFMRGEIVMHRIMRDNKAEESID